MVNADFVRGAITFGGPSAEWWVPLASSVVWGLGFSTLLTLVLTPVLLALPARIARTFERMGWKRAPESAARAPSAAPAAGHSPAE